MHWIDYPTDYMCIAYCENKHFNIFLLIFIYLHKLSKLFLFQKLLSTIALILKVPSIMTMNQLILISKLPEMRKKRARSIECSASS